MDEGFVLVVRKQKIKISSPARVCLFGDHQDYLGLPVIACAINRWINLEAVVNHKDHFRISLPDIQQERVILLDQLFEKLAPQDHLASSLRVMRRHGHTIDQGFDVHVKGNIPINAGVSSSSALVVSWIHFLMHVFGGEVKVTAQSIAQYAYEAEVLEHDSPGGKMDQFTIASGGTVYIKTGDSFSVTPIHWDPPCMILAESGIAKQTIGVLGDLRTRANKAIEEIKTQIPEFKIENATLKDLNGLIELVAIDLAPIFEAAVRNHHITLAAYKELQKVAPNMSTLGTLLNEHHAILKNKLKITLPLIDKLIDGSLRSGAYGAKIVGSGGGGCVVALCSEENKDRIIKSFTDNGAKAAYEVRVAAGTKLTE
ncbi:MAG: galactokinase [Flavobacteriaceae bacterium]|nr:galactokinase [Flavobacteriaceae bacterium]